MEHKFIRMKKTYPKQLRINQTLSCFCMIILLLFFHPAHGQKDTLSAQKPRISFTGFMDVFYAYDLNEPKTDYRLPFLYNHNRHNEFNLNLGLLKMNVSHSKYRANFALQAGTYVNDNYSVEPAALKNIYEGNIGISLNKKNNLWVDAGIFGSHIGFESAVSKDSWTLTRSLLAENSPYYLSGIKLTYNPNDRFELAAIVCNGWQRIKKVSGNSLPSFCTQIKYKKTDKFILNWSTFIGTDDPDTLRRMRYFNNFYFQSKIIKKFGLIAGFDIGAQQAKKDSSAYYIWYSPVLIINYALTEKWSVAARGEYYDDENGVIVPTSTPNGFKTGGISLNIDYSPFNNVLWRLEGRWLNSADKIFAKQNRFINENYCIVTSIAASF